MTPSILTLVATPIEAYSERFQSLGLQPLGSSKIVRQAPHGDRH